MNTFGRLFRVHIFGESHGTNLGVVLDGVPAGLNLSVSDFKKDLLRRNPSIEGTTSRKEKDVPRLVSGIFKDKTTGAPLTILFDNNDVDSSKYDAIKDIPRPGHADITAYQKFGGFNDYRGAGHFSGRITAGLVAAGVIAKKILKGIDINAKLISAGNPNNSIEKNIKDAMKKGDSIGGIVECRIKGLPAGLGEPFFDPIDAVLGHMILAIPGIKGLDFGLGFGASYVFGSEYNDPIVDLKGKTATNNAGGINGGISNGNELYFTVAVRPTASVSLSQHTVDIRTGKKKNIKVEGRHDTCFAVRVPVVVEAATAIVLADLMFLEQRIKRLV
jgi:chorismate synthase